MKKPEKNKVPLAVPSKSQVTFNEIFRGEAGSDTIQGGPGLLADLREKFGLSKIENIRVVKNRRITMDIEQKMLVLQELATDNPNQVGEILRGLFFNQSDGCFGCYSTFDLNGGVQLLPSEPVIEEEDEVGSTCNNWTCASLGGVKMRYFWDGDGTLEFLFPNGRYILNTDCKKDSRWSCEKPSKLQLA